MRAGGHVDRVEPDREHPMTSPSQGTSSLPDDADGDLLRDKCGVFGVFGHPDAAAFTALGLHALQHRGQEAAGIVTFDGRHFHSERRMGLRPPGYAIFGPIQLAWLFLFLGVTTPLISLSDGLWLLAAISVLPAVAATWLGWRALHQLSRRWLVFVPAGFVIHDPLLLGESILLRRTTVTSLGPANKSDLERGCDLSADAAGLSLKVVLTEPVDFAQRKKRDLIVTEADVIVFNPTLPGAVLREARTRAITIGAAAAS